MEDTYATYACFQGKHLTLVSFIEVRDQRLIGG